MCYRMGGECDLCVTERVVNATCVLQAGGECDLCVTGRVVNVTCMLQGGWSM